MNKNASWAGVVELLSRPKPSLVAEVAETTGAAKRRWVVIYDGLETWVLIGESTVELSTRNTHLLSAADGVKTYEGEDVCVAVNTGVKMLFDPAYIAYLDEAKGEVVGTAWHHSHECWDVRVSGLRRDDDTVLILLVNKTLGVIMRVADARLTAPFEISIESLQLGRSVGKHV